MKFTELKEQTPEADRRPARPLKLDSPLEIRHNRRMGAQPASSGPLYEGEKVSREEYLDLQDDGYQYDMIGGVLYVSPSATYEHSEAFFEFGVHLKNYLKKHPRGRVALEVDILLPDGGDVLRPDVNFILSENTSIIKGHVHGTPDLICESLSDSTEKRDLGEKAERYLACGVKEYWLVDSRDKSIQVWYNNGDSWEKSAAEVLESRLLSGFKIDAREFWAR